MKQPPNQGKDRQVIKNLQGRFQIRVLEVKCQNFKTLLNVHTLRLKKRSIFLYGFNSSIFYMEYINIEKDLIIFWAQSDPTFQWPMRPQCSPKVQEKKFPYHEETSMMGHPLPVQNAASAPLAALHQNGEVGLGLF